MKNKEQGITLVSLVVTIIILIILAGVSINLILGENGIITKSKQAKEKTEQAKLNEEVALNELYMQIEAEGISSGDASYDAIEKLVEFKREIATAISDMGIETSESANAATMASNIRSISGASSADKVSYDNTNSGLTSTNVQETVDELNNNLDKIFKVVTTTITTYANTQVFANSYVVVDLPFTAPEGYVPLCINNVTCSNYGQLTYNHQGLGSNYAHGTFQNITTNAIKIETITMTITYVKSVFL